MKFSSLVFLVAVGTASAFTQPAQRSFSRTFLASTTEESTETKESENATAPAPTESTAVVNGSVEMESSIQNGMDIAMPMPSVPDKARIQPGRYNDKENSIAMPFMNRPPALDGTHAGDFGFDPFGFTENNDLYTMQEAEIRHARLAMLAVIGWPMSELLAPDWMLRNGCAPSVLNGFNPVSFLSVVAIFGALGFFEFKTALRKVDNLKLGAIHQEDMADVWKWGVAGDYNFDPLNLYSSIGDDAYARKGLRELEISHGRSAMLGITAFVIWEKLTGHPIVENSMFFHPNALLPAILGAYVAFNQVYEFDDDDKTFLRFKMSSEGEARMENLKLSLPKEGSSEDFMQKVEKTSDFLSSIGDKYEQVQEAYLKNVAKVEGQEKN